jgi:hypothetical protein
MSTINEKMPGLLARVDDRWGLAWRVKNAIKEFSLTKSLKFARHYMSPPDYDRPIFILGENETPILKLLPRIAAVKSVHR